MKKSLGIKQITLEDRNKETHGNVVKSSIIRLNFASYWY